MTPDTDRDARERLAPRFLTAALRFVVVVTAAVVWLALCYAAL